MRWVLRHPLQAFLVFLTVMFLWPLLLWVYEQRLDTDKGT
jgi:hypothetical protein